MNVKIELLEREGKDNGLLLYLAFFCIIFGAKAIVISNFGSSIPYWDQWDAQADCLYRPWIEGMLKWSDLFASHNEHRIFNTRLLSLLLLYLNKGVWDPMFEMYFNAILHTAALVFLLFLMQKGLQSVTRHAFFFFAALLFVVPYGHENTLAGFQSQFYFLLLFSFIFLWAVTRLHTRHERWFPVIVFSAVLSYFSLASGALTIAAGFVTLTIRWFFSIQRSRVVLFIIFFLFVACATAIYFTPIIPDHAALKVKSLPDFIEAILRATGGGLLYIPIVFFMIKHFKNIRFANDHSWFIFALFIWVIGQIFAIAYGRSSGILSSRYRDLLSIGILINTYCLFLMLQNMKIGFLLKNSVFIYFLSVFIGLGIIAFSQIKNIQLKKANSLQSEYNVRSYLVTGDYTFLQKKPDEEIPYPSAVRLKSLLDNKIISSILTPVVNSHNANKGLGFYEEQSKKTLNITGSVLIFFGIGLFLVDLIKLYMDDKCKSCL